ncbi:MAG: hypothetical protein EBS01_15050, partial [Verrucomicrobia bacterium]|nr:hypothetical protein [Verrucomicrobiota bacterium]
AHGFGSSEAVATLTFGAGASKIVASSGAGPGSSASLSFTNLVPQLGSSIDVTLDSGLEGISVVTFITGKTSGGIQTGTLGNSARFTVGGVAFAGTLSSGAVKPFDAYNTTNALDSALDTDTPFLSASTNYSFSRTLNALAIGDGVTLGGPVSGSFLTLSAAGVLVGNGTSSAMATLDRSAGLAFGSKEAMFHTTAGGTLEVLGQISGTGGLTKTLDGLLLLSAPQFYTGMTSVNGGTLRLSNGMNTLFPGQNLGVNYGGLLELGDGSQIVGDLMNASSRSGVFEGKGGVIQGNAMSMLVTNQSNNSRTFAGQMQGGMTFVRTGSGSLFLNADNTYTGSTVLQGGVTTLRDFGKLSGTTGLVLNYGELRLDNSGYAGLSGRVNTAAAVQMNGGILSIYGRAQTASSETLGDVNLMGGFSTITLGTGGTGVNSLDV